MTDKHLTYRVQPFPDVPTADQLNALAKEGWRLVTIVPADLHGSTEYAPGLFFVYLDRYDDAVADATISEAPLADLANAAWLGRKRPA